jgi:hypothetical protein
METDTDRITSDYNALGVIFYVMYEGRFPYPIDENSN